MLYTHIYLDTHKLTHTCRAIFWEMYGEAGGVKDRGVVIQVQDVDSKGHAAVEPAHILCNQEELHPGIQESLAV